MFLTTTPFLYAGISFALIVLGIAAIVLISVSNTVKENVPIKTIQDMTLEELVWAFPKSTVFKDSDNLDRELFKAKYLFYKGYWFLEDTYLYNNYHRSLINQIIAVDSKSIAT